MTISREDFLARRKQGIGGSDVAAILGLSRWRNAVDVWRDKVDDSPVVVEMPSDVLALASYLEEYTAQKYAALTGYKVRRFNKLLTDEQYPFLIGNIDREICAGEAKAKAGILECKALSRFSFAKVKMYGLPDDYVLQMQHYFRVCNGRFGWGAFAILNRDSGELLTFEVMPDKALYDKVLPKLVKFWTFNVQTKTMPTMDSANAPKVEKAPSAGGGKVEDLNADAELAAMLNEYSELSAMSAEATELLDGCKQRIAQRMESYECAECAGKRLFYKGSKRVTFDSKRFKIEKPEEYYKYARETETARSLRIYNINNTMEG